LDWCHSTYLYGTLIGRELRNKRLLRRKLADFSATWSSSCEEPIPECLEPLSLPSLFLRAKINFVLVREVTLPIESIMTLCELTTCVGHGASTQPG
jgi:hypothetical protein